MGWFTEESDSEEKEKRKKREKREREGRGGGKRERRGKSGRGGHHIDRCRPNTHSIPDSSLLTQLSTPLAGLYTPPSPHPPTTSPHRAPHPSKTECTSFNQAQQRAQDDWATN
jgi:hypothetical protein